MITVINASAAVTLLKQRPEKKFQALNGIRTHDLCDAGAVLSQLSYQSHMRAMCGFIAQLVEHRTGIAEVTGSNPVEALIFSGFFFPIA